MARDFACAYLSKFVTAGSLALWGMISFFYEAYLCPVTRKISKDLIRNSPDQGVPSAFQDLKQIHEWLNSKYFAALPNMLINSVWN